MAEQRSTGTTMSEGMGWRMAAGVVTCIGALVAMILWLFFYAGSYNVYQNIAVIGVIFIACCAVMGAIMFPWFKQRRAWWSMGGTP